MSGVFPILSKPQASKFYRLEVQDTALSTQTEGGYTLSRARHTRKPRKLFTTGFSNLLQADKDLLVAFYNAQRGGADVFTWNDPVSTKNINVRFAGTLVFSYVGLGGRNRFDVEIRLEQV